MPRVAARLTAHLAARSVRRARVARRATALLSALVTFGATTGVAYAVYRAVTSTAGSAWSTGTVALTDTDGDSALLALPAGRGGSTTSGCVRVTATGSVPATVRQYATLTGTLGDYLRLRVTRGSGTTGTGASASSCSGFTPDATDYAGAGAGVVFDDRFSRYPDAEAVGTADPTVGGASGYAPTVRATTGLLSYWRLGQLGGTTARDETDASPGTYAGGVELGTAGAIAGDADRSAGFDGVDDAVTVPRTISTDFTIELWFRSTQGLGTTGRWTDGAALVDGDVAGTANDFGVALGADGRVLAGTGNPDRYVASAAGYNDGEWHHVAFTRARSSGALALYVDGALAATGTGGTQALTAATQLKLGARQSGGGFLAGRLDEVAVHGTALSAATIAAHDAAAPAPESWTTNETHTYRYEVTIDEDAAAEGRTAGATFTWRAKGS